MIFSVKIFIILRLDYIIRKHEIKRYSFRGNEFNAFFIIYLKMVLRHGMYFFTTFKKKNVVI